MATYKVSYVIVGNDDPGTILNQENPPKPGDRVELRSQYFEIVEVFELVPPRGDFHYVHATCKPVPPSESPKT
jgi:hypothetical protein